MAVGSPDLLINIMLHASILFGFANVGLLLGLLHVYWENYKDIKSKYTLGRIIFASVFLFQSIFLIMIVMDIILVSNVTDRLAQAIPAVIVFLEFIALSILLKINWE